MELSKDEIERYSRQILIPEFGVEGQLKLKNASVLVIGCGGLGSPVLLYLTAAGIGRIGIIENDTVDSTNLQRQILFEEKHVGSKKIDAAAERISGLNQNVIIEKYSTRLNRFNALEIVEKYDLIVDGSDNFPTRYLVNDACEILNIPFVYGAIHQFEGQVSVFNFKGGVTYRDLFAKPPSSEMAPNCSTAGVLGMMAGIIGSLQALEAVKIITEIGKVLSGQLLLVEALSMSFRKIKIHTNLERESIQELIDYEAFCSSSNVLQNISFEKFMELNKNDYQLIDVRTEAEYLRANLGGELIPLDELESQIPRIKKDKTVVFHCQSGGRSQMAIRLLQEKYDFTNLVNLQGGMNAIDS
jgi:sulfur-carrier protein adenylyltransferase/sulfurtransferase